MLERNVALRNLIESGAFAPQRAEGSQSQLVPQKYQYLLSIYEN